MKGYKGFDMHCSSYRDLIFVDENRQKYLSKAKKCCKVVIKSKVRLHGLRTMAFLPFKRLLENHLESKISSNNIKTKFYLSLAEEVRGVV